MLRKDMPRNEQGRIKVCCYVTKLGEHAALDEVCGVPTKRYWDRDTEQFEYKALCAEHALKVANQPEDED